MKKFLLTIFIFVIFTILFTVFLLPNIKIKNDTEIKYITLTDDISEYDELTCYDDGMSYYEKEDITIRKIDVEKFFIFYKITLGYENGNLCAYEYVLEEEYIKNYINNAVIKDNEKNIDIAKLIAGKTAIVGNTRYLGNDYETSISYILDGKEEILYVFYVDDLLVIQVGLSDEGPKFIAYI